MTNYSKMVYQKINYLAPKVYRFQHFSIRYNIDKIFLNRTLKEKTKSKNQCAKYEGSN